MAKVTGLVSSGSRQHTFVIELVGRFVGQISHDAHTEPNALMADMDLGSREKLRDIVLAFPAKRTVKRFNVGLLGIYAKIPAKKFSKLSSFSA